MNLPIHSVDARVQASELPLEMLAKNEHVTEAHKTMEVARQFEAVLLRQILQSAHKTGLEGMTDEGSASKDVYFDMMNFHLADTISKAGGLGLANSLQAQLLRQSAPARPEMDEPYNESRHE